MAAQISSDKETHTRKPDMCTSCSELALPQTLIEQIKKFEINILAIQEMKLLGSDVSDSRIQTIYF